jgi:hypothetical protein
MWQAKLLSVNYDLTKEVGRVVLSVNLFHESGQNVNKDYIIWVDSLETVSLSTIKTLIDADLARLEKLTQIIIALNSKIGLVI